MNSCLEELPNKDGIKARNKGIRPNKTRENVHTVPNAQQVQSAGNWNARFGFELFCLIRC